MGDYICKSLKRKNTIFLRNTTSRLTLLDYNRNFIFSILKLNIDVINNASEFIQGTSVTWNQRVDFYHPPRLTHPLLSGKVF